MHYIIYIYNNNVQSHKRYILYYFDINKCVLVVLYCGVLFIL